MVHDRSPVLELPRPELVERGRLRMLHVPPSAISDVRVARFPVQVASYELAVAHPVRPVEGLGRARVRGAVHDATGKLVGASQRARPGPRWRTNPEHRDAPTEVRRLEGRSWFGGTNSKAYGHVLLEVLGRFHPRHLDASRYDHVILYPIGAPAPAASVAPSALVLAVLGLVGVRPEQVVVVGHEALLLEHLDVAPAAIRLTSAVHPRLVRVFDAIGDQVLAELGPTVPTTPRRVYLSRARLEDRRKAANEEAVEQLATDRGFVVVHPQELSLAEQVVLMRQADVVAGCDGSALHSLLFARPGTKLVSFDTRPTPNQLMIGWVRGIDAVHVDAATEDVANRLEAWTADLDRVEEALDLALADDGRVEAGA